MHVKFRVGVAFAGGDEAVVRSLEGKDVAQIDAAWKYRSATSVARITRFYLHLIKTGLSLKSIKWVQKCNCNTFNAVYNAYLRGEEPGREGCGADRRRVEIPICY